MSHDDSNFSHKYEQSERCLIACTLTLAIRLFCHARRRHMPLLVLKQAVFVLTSIQRFVAMILVGTAAAP